MCIGQKARNLVQQREIVQEEEGVVSIKKLKRKPNGKVISTAMEKYIFPPTLYRDGGTSFLSRGCSHIYRNELAKSGDAVQYLSSQNEVKYACKFYKSCTVTHLEIHIYIYLNDHVE